MDIADEEMIHEELGRILSCAPTRTTRASSPSCKRSGWCRRKVD